ncbi:hypothetical protein BLNAU_20163 [Blattamonas nauphoetae]|uniref:Uncharacterized protein n=1 Tax=Blattamonas nauphoetae TaxID=2049346 RepID=A0ABQ9X3N1_9EUKA|nr:hypothetical protein BLNAU_20163 [Blattamonas nauphoetae]
MSPFVIGDSGMESSASISIISCSHHSSTESPSLLPLVSDPASFPPSPRDSLADRHDADTFGVGSVSIVGSQLTVKSKHLLVGTGPLFDFGHFFGTGLSGIVGCSVSLSSSFLINTTSTHLSSRSAPSCSFLTQRLVGVSVSESTNHLSGTSGVPLDWAGSSLLSNCSFSSCITNTAPDPITEPTKDPSKTYTTHVSKSSRISHSQSTNDTTVHNHVWIMSCDFAYLTSKTNGSAIDITGYRADVVIKDSSFERCQSTSNKSFGGALHLTHAYNSSATDKFFCTLFNCQFVNNTSARTGGHISGEHFSPFTIAQCTFKNSRSTTSTRLAQNTPVYIFLYGPCRIDNCTLSKNEGGVSGGVSIGQHLPTGYVILTDVLFEDNVCTAATVSAQFTDCSFYDSTGLPQCQFINCFSTSAQPHFGIFFPPQIKPDWIGPSITSVDMTIQENGDGDGFEVVLSFEGVFTGTSRKYDVTLEDADGNAFVAEQVSFSKTAGTATFALDSPQISSLSSSTEYKIVDVQKSSSQSASNEMVFEGETEPDWTWWHHTPESRAGSMVGLSFTTPAVSTLTNIEAELNPSNGNESIVVVTLDRILGGSFTLVVFDSSDALQTEISIGQFSFTFSSTPTTSSHTVVVYPSGLLSYGKTYTVKTLSSSTLIVSHTSPTFTIPNAPPTVTLFSIQQQNNPSQFMLVLEGMELPVGERWTVTLTTGYHISGSFVRPTMGESDPLEFKTNGVDYDRTYTVANVSLENGTTINLQINVFTTPPAPVLSSVRASLDESKENLILVLTGKTLPHGACWMTLNREDNNQYLDLEFNCWSDEISPTFSMSSNAQLDYGKT